MMRPWTLRRRLVVAIVALLALASIAIGTVSVLTLRSVLVGRLDQQLSSTFDRSNRVIDDEDDRPRGDGPPSAPGYLELPGQSPGTLAVLIIGGTAYSGAVLGENGTAQSISVEQAERLARTPATSNPQTVDLAGLGDYRVVTRVFNDDRLIIGLPMASVDAPVRQLALVVVLVTIAGLIAVGLVGALTVRWSLRPLERVVRTATDVSELPLDRGEVALAVRVPDADADERTEVGRVGASINRMLGHIGNALQARQASEQKVRTFVADASHELRTPLASIRGYAELTRRSGHDLPPDIVHALSRVESESIRMTSLVEDLLLLARLDEGRELERSSVDLGSLVADAVSDARASGTDHEWRFDAPDAPLLVDGDRSRLHQVVANLLANAKAHTAPGTVVTTSLARDERRGTTVLTVHDTGAGIAPELLPTVFERFVRGDGSRSRAAGSTGLGLAIVAAVVEAHGGTVDVTSEPGSTTFTVSLPTASA